MNAERVLNSSPLPLSGKRPKDGWSVPVSAIDVSARSPHPQDLPATAGYPGPKQGRPLPLQSWAWGETAPVWRNRVRTVQSQVLTVVERSYARNPLRTPSLSAEVREAEWTSLVHPRALQAEGRPEWQRVLRMGQGSREDQGLQFFMEEASGGLVSGSGEWGESLSPVRHRTLPA